MRFKLLILVFLISQLQVFAQSKAKVAVIGFYNVENLFDTIDNPYTNDQEFLPDGANAWNSEKYNKKLLNMSEVISQIGDEYIKGGPTILGVAEVENELVLRDLIKTPKLINSGYEIVHYESPDYRGIDVGFLYKKESFTVVNSTNTKFFIEDNPKYRTRSQLCVTGLLGNDTISIIVNHWPARGNDEKYRLAAAQLTKNIADSLYNRNPEAKIVIMGDLNDDPIDKSIKNVLGAEGKLNNVKKYGFFNPMWKMYKQGIGTLAYRDAWSIFDQIIVSKPLLEQKNNKWSFHKAHVFYRPFLIATEGQYSGYPLRTFSNGVFINGYSDHLPVYISLIQPY